VVLKVDMMCGGCEGAVRRVLKNMPGARSAVLPRGQAGVLLLKCKLTDTPAFGSPDSQSAACHRRLAEGKAPLSQACAERQALPWRASRAGAAPAGVQSVDVDLQALRGRRPAGPDQVCKQGRAGRAGVQNVDVDLPTQKVIVTGDVTQDAVLETVAKSGKKTELWR